LETVTVVAELKKIMASENCVCSTEQNVLLLNII